MIFVHSGLTLLLNQKTVEQVNNEIISPVVYCKFFEQMQVCKIPKLEQGPLIDKQISTLWVSSYLSIPLPGYSSIYYSRTLNNGRVNSYDSLLQEKLFKHNSRLNQAQTRLKTRRMSHIILTDHI